MTGKPKSVKHNFVRHPVIGMRVQINDNWHSSLRKNTAGEILCDYDQTRGNTGTLVDIQSLTPAAHSYKLYVVKLDPPNIGHLQALSTNWFHRLQEKTIPVTGGADGQ